MKKAYLILENGRVFEGERIGAEKCAAGEIVFNTGACGYLETLTDPGYAGQIIMETFPLIGSYGSISEDVKGDIYASGYAARSVTDFPSNFRADGTLSQLLKEKGVCAIAGIDTREITLILRSEGTMRAVIADEIPDNFDKAFAAFCQPVREAGVKEKRIVNENGKYKVALIDYGVRETVIDELILRNLRVEVLPKDVKAEEIMSGGYDGIVLSDGPGDPCGYRACIKEISELFGHTPIFAMGLGHQLLAISAGARTEKMLFGHRGANQPVRDRKTGRTVITRQNHGYCVIPASLPGSAVMRLENANDHSLEGIDYPEARAFSVQFQPEDIKGFLDEEFLFSRFISMMEG